MRARRLASNPDLPPDAGVTLLELLVVLGIIALVMGLALPSLIATRDQVRLKPLAAQITADLKRARVASIMRGVPVALIVDPKSHSYSVEGSSRSTALPPASTVIWSMPRGSSKFSPATQIVFYPDGSATAGQLTLGDDHAQKLVLTINALTGSVTRTTRK